jgi:hypothetical protein
MGGVTCVLPTFSKISRCQFRRHRALLISAIDNRRWAFPSDPLALSCPLSRSRISILSPFQVVLIALAS